MKKTVRQLIKMLGYEIQRAKNPPSELQKKINPLSETMLAGLIRNKDSGLNPSTIIDVGAASGEWTKKALTLWPEAEYVLFEPLQEREEVLTSWARRQKNIHLVKAAAGEKPGEIAFFVTEDLDGSGIADNGSHAQNRTIPVTTIDEEINKLQLSGPFLIKLDTHGFEVPILMGAGQTLKQAQLVIIECYGFQIAPNSLLFWEMCGLMQEKGFRLYDIVDVMRREKDHAFWQCDAFFIPDTSPVFNSNTYL